MARLRGEPPRRVRSVRLDPDLEKLLAEVRALLPTLKKDHAVILAALRIGLKAIKENPELGIEAHAQGLLARAQAEGERVIAEHREATKKKK